MTGSAAPAREMVDTNILLIWAAAKENDIAVIYTEDFQHGRDIEGVRFHNPFVAGG
jgi:predicted nucleic acid-binding protein